MRDRVTTTRRMRQRTDDTQTDVAKAVAAVQEALRMCTRASKPSIPRNNTTSRCASLRDSHDHMAQLGKAFLPQLPKTVTGTNRTFPWSISHAILRWMPYGGDRAHVATGTRNRRTITKQAVESTPTRNESYGTPPADP